jgi:hypothetical protein
LAQLWGQISPSVAQEQAGSDHCGLSPVTGKCIFLREGLETRPRESCTREQGEDMNEGGDRLQATQGGSVGHQERIVTNTEKPEDLKKL